MIPASRRARGSPYDADGYDRSLVRRGLSAVSAGDLLDEASRPIRRDRLSGHLARGRRLPAAAQRPHGSTPRERGRSYAVGRRGLCCHVARDSSAPASRTGRALASGPARPPTPLRGIPGDQAGASARRPQIRPYMTQRRPRVPRFALATTCLAAPQTRRPRPLGPIQPSQVPPPHGVRPVPGCQPPARYIDHLGISGNVTATALSSSPRVTGGCRPHTVR